MNHRSVEHRGHTSRTARRYVPVQIAGISAARRRGLNGLAHQEISPTDGRTIARCLWGVSMKFPPKWKI